MTVSPTARHGSLVAGPDWAPAAGEPNFLFVIGTKGSCKVLSR